MIEKITDQNLERYDSRLKEWCDRKFFEKGNYGKYETTEEAGAVAFYPAPNTPLEGKVKFSFKETMPEEGAKGPDNPSTINGVSNISVTRCGKNLIKSLNTWTSSGVTFTANTDGSVSITRTASGNTVFYQLLTGNSLKVGLTYSLSGCPLDPNNQDPYSFLQRFGNHTTPIDVGNGTTWEVIDDSISRAPLIRIDGNYTPNNLVIYPQIELGSTVTAYEKGEGTDYTIQLGDTYYGGEIDLATGVMTVTKGYVEINSVQAADYLSNGNVVTRAWYDSFDVPEPVNDALEICAELPRAVNGQGINRFFVSSPNSAGHSAFYIIFNQNLIDFSNAVDSSNPTLNEIKEAVNSYLVNHPLHIVYSLKYPYTVQLTPQQILSLTQTNKYTPRLNTVYTDADSIQISYLKSPIRDEYEKTQAILSLGGNS